MLILLAWTFVLMSLIIVGYMARQAYTGKHSLLSIRNFFLVGLIVFQCTSAATAYFTEKYGELPINDPVGSGAVYLFLLTTFLILFLVFYELGWFTFGIQRRFRISLPIPGNSSLVTVSITMLIAAALCRFVISKWGLIGIMADIGAGAMAAMAAGTASWAWAGRPKNFGLFMFMLGIVVAAAGISIVDAFGRREIVNVMVGCLWGAYHGGFRYANLRRAAVPLAIIGLGGFILVAAFTDTRGYGDDKAQYSERLQRMASADVLNGTMLMLQGQDAAGDSIWVIETRPEPFPYDPLGSLVYLVVHPIPRDMWEGKPIGLGMGMVSQSQVQGKGEGYTMGPGLIGHIVNDNPWLSLPLYALLLAAWLRILDDLLTRFPHHPSIVLPMGIELGEILGLARGELGLFIFQAVTGMAFAYFGTILVAKFLGMLGLSGRVYGGDMTPIAEEDAESVSAGAQE